MQSWSQEAEREPRHRSGGRAARGLPPAARRAARRERAAIRASMPTPSRSPRGRGRERRRRRAPQRQEAWWGHNRHKGGRVGKRQSRRGFTLWEVMGVRVILGILAVLIVPRVLGRTDEARAAAPTPDIPALLQSLQLYR